MASRFTFDANDDITGVYSPDGSQIAWVSNRSGAYELYIKPANGTGNDELLLKTGSVKYADDWSYDGKYILYENVDPKTKFDLWILPVFGDRKPFPYLTSGFNEAHARFAPDGKWIVYASDESGRTELYVQSFPTGKGKWQISKGGGDQPFWRQDGKELFYVAPDGKLRAVEILESSDTIQPGNTTTLANVQITTSGIVSARSYYVAHSSGQEFTITMPVEDLASLPITVVLNWPKLLRK
jgi:Tol biopolymer transport system component